MAGGGGDASLPRTLRVERMATPGVERHMDIVETPAPGRNHARLAIRIGKRSGVTADVSVTPAGLLSIGALVSAILLSSAVIVRAARTDK